MQDIQSIMLRKFMEGCCTGNVSVVKDCLADSSFDPNYITTDSGRLNRPYESIMITGFIEACYRGHVEIVRLLLQGPRIDINKRDRDGMTGFMYACYYGHTEIVRLLLKIYELILTKQIIMESQHSCVHGSVDIQR